MEKTIEIPEGYEARIEGRKVIIELKESEDERIRKGLVKMISDIDGGHPFENYGIIKKEALAYLEKQKDEAQKQFNLGMQAGRKEVMYEMEKEQDKCPEYCVRSHCIGCSIYEKRKEQKPVEDWPNLSNCIKDCKKCKGKCFYRKEMYQEQENVSVGDDNKLYVEDILSLLNFGCSTHSRNEIDMWIKSLPERLNPKPAGWSEEDEKYLNLAINIVASDFGEDSPTVSWLKSLRPQPHWKPSEKECENKCPNYSEGYGCSISPLKRCETCSDYKTYNSWKPSEEQMKALLEASDLLVSDLNSLYNDLKKL